MDTVRPRFFYDSDCAICSRLKDLATTADHAKKVEFVPLADARRLGLLPNLTDRQLFSSSHLLRPDGRLLSGGDSMLGLASFLPGGRLPANLISRAPQGPAAVREFYALLSRRHSSSCAAIHGLSIPKSPPKVDRP